MDTDKGDKELLRYRPVKKKGPLAKKLEQNLCYLDMGTFPNKASAPTKNTDSQPSQRYRDFITSIDKTRSQKMKLSDKLMSNISFLDIKPQNNDDHNTGLDRSKAIRDRLSTKLKQNLQYLDICTPADTSEKVKLHNKDSMTFKGPERNKLEDTTERLLYQSSTQDNKQANYFPNTSSFYRTKGENKRSRYDRKSYSRYETEFEIENHYVADKEIYENYNLKDNFDKHNVKLERKRIDKRSSSILTLKEDIYNENSKNTFQSYDYIKRGVNELSEKYGRPMWNWRSIGEKRFFDDNESEKMCSVNIEDQLRTKLINNKSTHHNLGFSPKINANETTLNQRKLTTHIEQNLSSTLIDTYRGTDMIDINDKKTYIKPSAATLEALRGKLSTIDDKGNAQPEHPPRKRKRIPKQRPKDSQSSRTPVYNTRQRSILSKSNKASCLRGSFKNSCSCNRKGKAQNKPSSLKTSQKGFTGLSKKSKFRSKMHGRERLHKKNSIMVPEVKLDKCDNKTMYLIGDKSSLNDLLMPPEETQLTVQEILHSPRNTNLSSSESVSNEDLSDVSVIEEWETESNSPENIGDTEGIPNTTDDKLNSKLGLDIEEEKYYDTLQNDANVSGEFEAIPREMCEELDNSFLNRISVDRAVTDLDLAILVASQSASLYVKENVTASGGTYYDFPMSTHELEEESLWITTHALLRMLGATDHVYSRLLAISQRTSASAVTILRSFLGLLYKACDGDATERPDVLETVREIARQMKVQEEKTIVCNQHS